MDILGIAGIVVGLVVAWWEYARAKEAEAQLARMLHELPELLVENISRFISQSGPNAHHAISSHDTYSSAQYFDIDKDGHDELIVQFPAGVHGSALQIYGFDNNSFQLRAECWSGTPNGFTIDTSDPNCSPLLRSIENSTSADFPYVLGLRDVVWHKLENGKLIEYKRQPPPRQEIEDRLKFAGREQGGIEDVR